jgi:uncharacterized membrane protein YwaF
MRPWLVPLVFGTLGELFMSASLFAAVVLTFRYSLGVGGFTAIFLGMILLAMICLLIECGYGLHRRYGWAVALKRYRRFRSRKMCE